MIIGESPQIKRVLSLAEKIAKMPFATTLIVGESGTGKELVARHIHELCADQVRPFIDINCSALPENLLESELFGYEKGAFTDARTRKLGLFELAHDGTIFLDEIANTSPALQSKLLKVVENKAFRRIGGTDEIQVKTRIIAASNVDLQEAVAAGKFREDLFYRLNVCRIELSPLRDRPEDILELAAYFIAQANEQYNLNVRGLTSAARVALLRHHWPGNVRELKNCIERAMLLESDRVIRESDLGLVPPAAPADAGSPKQVNPGNMLAFTEFPKDGIPLEKLEKQIITAALKKAGGNICKAARLLHIQRGKLRYRIERLKIADEFIQSLRVEERLG